MKPTPRTPAKPPSPMEAIETMRREVSGPLDIVATKIDLARKAADRKRRRGLRFTFWACTVAAGANVAIAAAGFPHPWASAGLAAVCAILAVRAAVQLERRP